MSLPVPPSNVRDERLCNSFKSVLPGLSTCHPALPHVHVRTPSSGGMMADMLRWGRTTSHKPREQHPRSRPLPLRMHCVQLRVRTLMLSHPTGRSATAGHAHCRHGCPSCDSSLCAEGKVAWQRPAEDEASWFNLMVRVGAANMSRRHVSETAERVPPRVRAVICCMARCCTRTACTTIRTAASRSRSSRRSSTS